jgi:hypothetical protein
VSSIGSRRRSYTGMRRSSLNTEKWRVTSDEKMRWGLLLRLCRLDAM